MEYKVYVLNEKAINGAEVSYEELDDEEFRELAGSNVYSLEDFEIAFNEQNVDTETDAIRIIKEN